MKKPIAYEAYQQMAEAYAKIAPTKPHNAYYDKPAMLSLLPDIKGKYILDAGCGPGIYLEILSERGASELVGLDASEKMISIARKKKIPRAKFSVRDLNRPLVDFSPESFDLILSALTISYLPDLNAVFSEFHRLLKPQGHLLISTQHPFMDFLYFDSQQYFATEQVTTTWKGFGAPVEVPCYRRPMQDLVLAFLNNGYTLEKFLEPRPLPRFKELDPKHYEELMQFPGFVCLRGRKN